MTSQLEAHFATMFAVQDNPPPAIHQSRFTRPPRSQDRHGPPTANPRERRHPPICDCCGLNHAYGTNWCNKRGPNFIRDSAMQQRVMQYNAQHRTDNPLLQELITEQATQPGVPQAATIPSSLRPHA
mmetsp:Transcript_12062/g.21924  ORF Transcript_12062/g.21924 Transcript_12062/m.21924 type:complete len:127 (+) Transcript_12062:510-890(+)